MKLNVIQPCKWALIVAIQTFCITAYAQADISTINQLEQAQFEQRKDLIKQNINEPQVNLQTDIQSINNTLPANETPCFTIDTIRIDVDADYLNKFKGVLKPITQGSNSIIGQCIGQQGLSYIADQVQNEILKKGYITTRVSIPEQDLNSKVLTLKIVPGLYNNVWLSDDSEKDANTYNAITLKTGDILNLRELETSLENFRLPQTSTTSIDIIPSIEGVASEAYGVSDLLITQKKSFPLGFQLTVDDSGNTETGKYLGTLGINIDHPLQANDVLYLSYTHTIDPWNKTDKKSNNDSIYAQYIYPFRDWKLNLNYNDYTFNQTLAGLNNDIVYKGSTLESRAGLSKILYRNQHAKTTITLGGFKKSSKYYFDNEEIEVQRRKTAGWTLGLNHQQDTQIGKINAGINYEKGTGAFSAIKSPESYIGEADDRPSIVTAHIDTSIPFMVNQTKYYYQVGLVGQYTDDRVAPNERFIIGGRSTVRGVDSQQSIAGDKGLLIKQEIGRIFNPSAQFTLIPYITLDQGLVYGDWTEYLSNNQLISSTFGMKLYYPNFSLNGFIGKALKAPKEVEKETVTGFSASVYY